MYPKDCQVPQESKKPEGLQRYIFSIWSGITVISGIASLIGFVVFVGINADVIAATTAVAAGAILAMLTDTMIPEAFEVTYNYAGFITGFGFLCAFLLSKLG